MSVKGQLALPSLFSNDMVFQQQAEVPVWGWGNPSETVKVVPSWSPQDTASVVVSGEGLWKTSIQTTKAGGPYSLQVFVTGRDSIELTNVMLGEVWLCSGQSNMEWSAAANIVNKEQEIAAANHPNLRIFQVAKRTASTPQENCQGEWRPCTPYTMPYTSAVGYFFARHLMQQLDVPVGIIVAAWGGTPYETWTKRESIENNPILHKLAPTEINPWRPNLTATCYNQMIHPIIPFTIAGAIWYQGETNVGNPYYAMGMEAMINNWRSEFGKEFPFYLVQIAPFTYRSGNNEPALLREQQELVTRLVPKTGMVVVSDLVDNIEDIHPIDKQNVGLRLANLALAENYQQSLAEYKSPTFESMRVEKGKAIITLRDAETGLVCKENRIKGFKIAAEDGIFVDAEATIKGNEVMVSSPEVKQPTFVTYCFDDTTIGNLFTKGGLPVAPFRSNGVKSFYE